MGLNQEKTVCFLRDVPALLELVSTVREKSLKGKGKGKGWKENDQDPFGHIIYCHLFMYSQQM